MFSSLALPQLCNNLQFCLDAHWELLRHNSRLNSRRQRVLRYENDRANTLVLDAHLRSHFLRIMTRFLSRNKINTSGWASMVSLKKMIVQWKRERIENECCSCSSIFFYPSDTSSNSPDGYDYLFSRFTDLEDRS